MSDLNYLALGVAAVAAFVLSSSYYAVLGNQMASLSDAYVEVGQPPAWKVLTELARSLVVATVLAGLADQTGTETWTGALLLALALWIGFPVVLWTGAVIWERVPVRLSAIHAGDWLLKLAVVAVIVAVWQ